MKPPKWRPLDSDVVDNPYPYLRDLRVHHPIFRSQTGEWVVSSYNLVREILTNKSQFAAGNRLHWMQQAADYAEKKGLDYQSIPSSLQSFILFKNPPEHTRMRKWIHQHWRSDVDNMDLIEELLHKKGDFDFVEQFAKPLPLLSISNVLGIPRNDAKELKTLSYELIRAMDLYLSFKDLQQIANAARKLMEYFTERVRNPDLLEDGILKNLMEDTSLDLSEDQLASACIFLFIAGQETTSAFLSTMSMHLSDDKRHAQLQEYSAVQVVEEILRFDPPVQLLGRIAAKNTELDANVIEESSTLTLCIGAANRDESVFEKPDEICFDRSSNAHMAFGVGIHRCLGDQMAMNLASQYVAYLQNDNRRLRIGHDISWDRHISVRRIKKMNVRYA